MCAASVLIADAETITFESRESSTLQSGIAILLTVQTALIVVLMIQNYRHRRAQDDARRQQSELTHAARLVLVGEMTASIAHEVSQPLGAILSNADAADMLLSAEPPPLDELRRILDDIRRDDLRANEIVRNLRRLLTRREIQMERIDVNEIVRSTLRLTREDAMRRGVSIRCSLLDPLPATSGDPVHLQQVLLNLILNAMDAMANATAGEREVQVITRMHSDRSIEVAVADCGTGIAGEALPRLFDSFYTTRRDGMGLGLSIARAIVHTHGGAIWVEEGQQRGAVFKFTLPVAA